MRQQRGAGTRHADDEHRNGRTLAVASFLAHQLGGKHRPDALEVHYTSRTPNLLRIAIPSYPGWQAVLGASGALLGGFLIGLLASLSDGYLNARWTNAWVFAVLVLILLFRPTGLLGENTGQKA